VRGESLGTRVGPAAAVCRSVEGVTALGL